MSDTDYILDVVTAPLGRVVDVNEMSEYLRWESPEEYGLIAQVIDAATEYVQSISGKQLLTATYDVAWRRFPGCWGEIVLPRVPVSSVTSVKYYNAAGTLTTLSSSLYTVNDGSEHRSGYIIPAFNEQWPSTYGHDRDVVVRFACGFGGKESVPQAFRVQIQMLASHWWKHRDAIACGEMSQMPLAFEALSQFNRHCEFV